MCTNTRCELSVTRVQLLATLDQTTSTITVSLVGLSGSANTLEFTMKKFAIAFLAVAFTVAVGCGPVATTAPKTTPTGTTLPTEKAK